jgi:NAD(P)-dependent dehydrogenase (short-subunit alcohol dehydrogenase family)
MSSNWTADDIPHQHGRLSVVTGTGGLGFETALALARAGGDVIIAGRSRTKGDAAVAKIRHLAPRGSAIFEEIDLGNLASIAAFGGRLKDKGRPIDVLVNNAGVMTPPRREVTSDGFELQFGTNYLGHFALSAHLLPLVRKSPAPRVVTLSSVAARSSDATIDFSDIQAERAYKPMQVYSRSKLACLMFAFELQRQSNASGWGITSVGAHPGVSRTDLLHNGSGRFSPQGLVRSMMWFLFQPAAQGALPTLFAATSSKAVKGGYYGPDRLGETRGYPMAATVPALALDTDVAKRLWAVSEDLVQMKFGE